MKIRAMLGLAAATGACAVIATAYQSSGTLQPIVEAMQKAEGLKATYTVTPMGKPALNYSVNFAKPDKARIDTPSQTIVADGKTMTFFLKKDKVYYKKAQTPELLAGILDTDELRLWSAFFNAKAFDRINAKAAGTVNRKGNELRVFNATVDLKTGKTMTLYVAADNLPRQAVVDVKSGSSTNTTIIDTQSVVAERPADSVLAWNAPAGSEEIKEEDLVSAEWYYDLDKALADAKRTNRLVLLDFMAEWCGPCKMLDANVYTTEDFKQMSKYFVFCKIDIDHNPALAKTYNVTAIPDVRFLDASGNQVGAFVGYRPTAEVIAEMKKAKGLN